MIFGICLPCVMSECKVLVCKEIFFLSYLRESLITSIKTIFCLQMSPVNSTNVYTHLLKVIFGQKNSSNAGFKDFLYKYKSDSDFVWLFQLIRTKGFRIPLHNTHFNSKLWLNTYVVTIGYKVIDKVNPTPQKKEKRFPIWIKYLVFVCLSLMQRDIWKMTLPIPELIAALEILFVYIIRAIQNKAIIVIAIHIYLYCYRSFSYCNSNIEVKRKAAKRDKYLMEITSCFFNDNQSFLFFLLGVLTSVGEPVHFSAGSRLPLKKAGFRFLEAVFIPLFYQLWLFIPLKRPGSRLLEIVYRSFYRLRLPINRFIVSETLVTMSDKNMSLFLLWLE